MGDKVKDFKVGRMTSNYSTIIESVIQLYLKH